MSTPLSLGCLGLGLALLLVLGGLGSIRAAGMVGGSVAAGTLAGLLGPLALGLQAGPAAGLGVIAALATILDHAITVQENVTRHRELGAEPRMAVRRGTAEVGRLVAGAGVAIGVALLSVGLAGQWAAPFGIGASAAILVSSLVAVTMPWAFPASSTPGVPKPSGPGVLTRWIDAAADRYHDALAWCLDRPALMLLLALAALAAVVAVARSSSRHDPIEAGRGGGPPIRIEIRGPDGSTLIGVAQRIRDEIERIDGASAVGLSGQGMSLDRLGGERVLHVEANASGRSVRDLLRDIEVRVETVPPPPGYRVTVVGRVAEHLAAMRRGAVALAVGAGFLALLLTRLLGWTTPVAVLLGLPVAILGAFVPATGGAAAGAAVLGTLALAVSQSTILLGWATRRRERGVSVRVALIEAGRLRLRPILLATGSLLGTLAPMAVGPEPFAMAARATMLGSVAAAFATTIVIPAIYELAVTADQRLGGRWPRLDRAVPRGDA